MYINRVRALVCIHYFKSSITLLPDVVMHSNSDDDDDDDG